MNKSRGRGDDAVAPSVGAESIGLTIREWYAGQALMGLLAGAGDEPPGPDQAARLSADYADSLLFELKNGGAS